MDNYLQKVVFKKLYWIDENREKEAGKWSIKKVLYGVWEDQK